VREAVWYYEQTAFSLFTNHALKPVSAIIRRKSCYQGDYVKVTAYTETSVFQDLQPYWNELLHRSESNLIFLTWEWQRTWWQAYEAGDLWVLVCRDENERIIGIAPWFIQYVNGERVVRTIGCVDVTDYVDLIAAKECIHEVQSALAAYVQANDKQFDRISLCNIPKASSTYQHFPARLRERGFSTEMVLQEVCPVIHLPESWDAYLESLDKKQRHEIRRKIRRAESEAEIEYYVVSERSDFQHEVEVFLELMAASQPAKAEFLRNPANRKFFVTILEETFAQGWLRLSFLRINGASAAAYCDFDYEGRILVYNSGLSLNHYPHLSSGIVLLAYNIKNAIETKHQMFDFLRGNETYKYRMGAEDTCVFTLVASKTVSKALPQELVSV
jgi:CelD/BcsL family acetyltransferase involved in cellulose biosynthesis